METGKPRLSSSGLMAAILSPSTSAQQKCPAAQACGTSAGEILFSSFSAKSKATSVTIANS
jgi:hypothetical protein